MLSEDVKLEIQQGYSRLLEEKGYKSRYCQRVMIAEIANTLGNIEIDADGERQSGPHVCVVEAGTGTGKTVAYAIAALPLAKTLGKKLVISTATVNLQEQIVYTDLPDIRRHAGLDFSFALAKGRRRYLCLSRLDMALQQSTSYNQTLALYDDEYFDVDESQRALFDTMLKSLGKGEWDGDRDSWPSEIEHSVWNRISTDHVQCTGKQCAHYDNCYFYRARERIHKVDCIVTNHDLVLSDLMMGGGTVLPSPEDTIYIFDEGHHLPEKAINHFSSFLQIRATQTWVEQIPETLKQLCAELGEVANLPGGLVQLEDRAVDVNRMLQEAIAALEPIREMASSNQEMLQYRFPMGRVPESLVETSAALYQSFRGILNSLDPVVHALEERLAVTDETEKERCEHWLPVISAMVSRVESATKLWLHYMSKDSEERAPLARWINFKGGGDESEIQLNVSPISVSETLNELLWSRAFGAVVTSATLAVAGDFTRFRQRSGIDSENIFKTLPSPFRFQDQGVLRVPKMDVDPREADLHGDTVAEMLPGLLDDVRGALVLFTSWRQMLQVKSRVQEELGEALLCQGTLSRMEIVSQHKQRVDSGEPSIIFGLASFAEGIDLPGEYCDHVVIIKIPFAVPDDPVGATQSEWIESRGGNAFGEIMIPDAALRMVQACGRLLRTENDYGTVTILDRRLVTQRYGKQLLEALPAFRREIE
ncbi:MAG: ATP-dependent DNA helicase DinG [Pseudomonadales bacterium]